MAFQIPTSLRARGTCQRRNQRGAKLIFSNCFTLRITVSETTTSKRTDVGLTVVADCSGLKRCNVWLSEGFPNESRTVTANVVGKPAVAATKAMTELINIIKRDIKPQEERLTEKHTQRWAAR